MNQPINVTIPSNPADRKAIKDALKEVADCMMRMDAEKEAIKDIIDTVVEKYDLPKKFVSKMARTYHKNSFDQETVDAEDFAALYETILK